MSANYCVSAGYFFMLKFERGRADAQLQISMGIQSCDAFVFRLAISEAQRKQFRSSYETDYSSQPFFVNYEVCGGYLFVPGSDPRDPTVSS
jgi:hypothetical protein